MTVVRCYNIECKHNVYVGTVGYGICQRTNLTIVGPGNECEDAEDE